MIDRASRDRLPAAERTAPHISHGVRAARSATSRPAVGAHFASAFASRGHLRRALPEDFVRVRMATFAERTSGPLLAFAAMVGRLVAPAAPPAMGPAAKECSE